MITALPFTIKQRLNKAYRLIKPKRAAMEAFKGNLVQLLNQIDEKETEENVKIHLMDFLKNTFYTPDHLVATKGKTDFVLHTGKEAKTPAGVLFEVKRPSNKADMVTKTNLNTKALHELVLYYLRERLDGQNTDMRHLVITNIYEWFVFDAQDFERIFGKSAQLKKDYEAWKTGQKVSNNTDHFYREIAKPFLDALPEELPFTYFNLKDFEKALRNQNLQDDNQLIGLYKVLSPVHLLKLAFTNDSNSLDKGFYAELLHLIGLEEIKVGNKKLIQRKAPERRQEGALLENAILTIESEDRLRKLNPPSAYGQNEEERLFTVALELCITWVNRILFLKLLEAQLIKYHRGSAGYTFLNYATIPQYDELNKLFFQVLARRPEQRTSAIQEKYGHVPYLNSSLFEPTDLEDDIIRVNSLDDMTTLPLHPNTVLRDAKNKPVAQSLNALEYLLRFLDAYDFASEGREEIQEESKTLINAAVLGLIFEKINGYKDGSIYTPGFITMYMCRQAIRLAVVQKFNDAYGWQAQTFDDLKNYLADHHSAAKLLEFNALLNSLHLCDPAVGSGHFLVSALNEIIAIKAELKLLVDYKGVRLAGHEVSIENDELIITDRDTQDIFEYTVKSLGSGKGLYIAPETQRVQQTLFHEKQTIIENCLFGVDINPNSVKICRLRLWIELLKNAYYTVGPGPEIYQNSSPVCYAESPNLRDGFAPSAAAPELQTLPNIDINIKQGNSLLSRFGLDTDLSEALRGTNYSVAQYRSFVQEYKNSHSKDRKRELETIINRIKADFRTEIYRNDPKVKRLQKITGELQLSITQTTMFAPSAKEKKSRQQYQQKLQTEIAAISAGIDEIKSNAMYRNAFEWRFEFPEVLDNDGNFEGFDVVIGNPPYISLSKIQDLGVYFERQGYETYSKSSDIYCLFYEKGIQLLKNRGYLSLITSNSWLKTQYGELLRRFFKIKTNPLILINIEDKQVFEEVTVESNILTIEKSSWKNKLKAVSISEDFNANYQIQDYLEDNGVVISDLDNNGWVIGSEIESGLKLKIENNSKLLKDFNVRINFGIKTGYNEAFIIDESTRNNLIKGNPNNREVIKPLFRGRDVRKYYHTSPNIYLINSHNGIKSTQLKSVNLEKEYPEVFKYFQKFEEKLKKRSDKGMHWTNLRSCAYILDFDLPKIVWGELSDKPKFAYDETGRYPEATLFFLVGENLKYLLAILNSKLGEWYFNQIATTSGMGTNRWKKYKIEQLPIKEYSEEQQVTIINKVNKILALKKENPQADTASLEREIDALVYQLYDLTPEEIAIVENT